MVDPKTFREDFAKLGEPEPVNPLVEQLAHAEGILASLSALISKDNLTSEEAQHCLLGFGVAQTYCSLVAAATNISIAASLESLASR